MSNSTCIYCDNEVNECHLICRECADKLTGFRAHILFARQQGKTTMLEQIQKDIVHYLFVDKEKEND